MGSVQSCLESDEKQKSGAIIDVDTSFDQNGEAAGSSSGSSQCCTRLGFHHRVEANAQSPKSRRRTLLGVRSSANSHIDNVTQDTIQTESSESQPQPSRRGPGQTFQSIAQVIVNLFHCVEESLLLKNPLLHPKRENKPAPLRVRGGVLLYGCHTAEDHYERIRGMLETVKDLHGAEGLKVAFGLEYRLVKCPEHQTPCHSRGNSEHDIVYNEVVTNTTASTTMHNSEAAFATMLECKAETLPSISHTSESQPSLLASTATTNNYHCDLVLTANSLHNSTESLLPILQSQDENDENASDSTCSNDGSFTTPSHEKFTRTSISTMNEITAMEAVDLLDSETTVATNNNQPTIKLFCNLCSRRLFHIESGVMIDESNRTKFIADEAMYEAVSRLVQEQAQDIMIQEGHLEWVTVQQEPGKEPLRILLSSKHPLLSNENRTLDNNRPTIMICTGRGKVRAGIFSRKNLICAGLETATALPMIRDAVTRNLHVAIIDPNVHGDAMGFDCFQKSMDFLQPYFDVEEKSLLLSDTTARKGFSSREMLILSHSASGGHLVRYFLDKSTSTFLRNIRAIAFTDSTHSIQWAKTNDKRDLFLKLQSDQCVYFRCIQERGGGIGFAGDNNKWYLHPAGESVQTDTFWQHRFGLIRTMWAGTDEHAMTNWFSHTKIWDHFDYIMFGKKFRRAAITQQVFPPTINTKDQRLTID